MAAKHSKSAKYIVGWSEYVAFPDWDIAGLKAKVDTGARSSALHVEDLEILPNNRVRFQVVFSRKFASKNVYVTADIEKRARVRSSNGKYSYRYFVRTPVKIGPITKDISISLVSREKMLFRMLIGRKALEKHFLVDVSKRGVRPAKSSKAKTASRQEDLIS